MKWVLPADSTGDYYFVFHPAYLLRCVAYFFAGAFLVNAIPHFVSGVTGHRFPSPFASPPGKGLSSPIVNVLWGTFNFAIAYLLIFRVGTFDFRSTRDMLLLAAGGLLMGINLAGWFGRTDHDESRSQ
jgi:hypothetical protein